jgi:hypothetical protein
MSARHAAVFADVAAAGADRSPRSRRRIHRSGAAWAGPLGECATGSVVRRGCVACCVAMAMPQVHIVAYCGDLGYGVARGPANEGIEWVILTNGAVWRVYNVHFGQPIEKILVCEVDLIALSPKSDEILECFGNLSREGFSKGKMADLLHQKQVTNKFTVAALLISHDILDDLRKEIRRLSGIKVEVDYLRALLTNEIVKRDLIDSEEAKAAVQNVKRLQNRTAARKKSSEKVLEEKPTMAPAEDASGYSPAAGGLAPMNNSLA